jgi:Arc/MetJ-type ribon-helix-helix transcriptional regulator
MPVTPDHSNRSTLVGRRGVSRVRRFTVSLPVEIAGALEVLCESLGQTPSEVIREALETVIRAERERDAEVRYMRAYRETPEDGEEVELGGTAWAEILRDYPWEDE